jgi:hypothetical protein
MEKNYEYICKPSGFEAAMKSESPILVKPSAEHERAFRELLGELEATEEQAMTFRCLPCLNLDLLD